MNNPDDARPEQVGMPYEPATTQDRVKGGENTRRQYAGVSRQRRNLIVNAATVLTAGVMGVSPPGQAQDRLGGNAASLKTGAFSGEHQMRPLAFRASGLKDLSTRMVESHWANNYGGSVRALNAINSRLAAALEDSSLPAFVYNDLKREHLLRTGSVVLHELYFDNLGGDGKAGSQLRSLIATAFGEFDRWETEFRKIAAGLGGGSGWVVLGYNQHFQALENYWMADHMHAPVNTVPLVVMDMYEHAYQMDFGAATMRYIDAFFANINWDSVAKRIAALGMR